MHTVHFVYDRHDYPLLKYNQVSIPVKTQIINTWIKFVIQKFGYLFWRCDFNAWYAVEFKLNFAVPEIDFLLTSIVMNLSGNCKIFCDIVRLLYFHYNDVKLSQAILKLTKFASKFGMKISKMLLLFFKKISSTNKIYMH